VQDCIHSTEVYREDHFILVNFTVHNRSCESVRLNHEAEEFRWVTTDAALTLPLNQPTLKLLQCVTKSGSLRLK